jgi:nitroimidazol reductase NimA-like FMN-containing flavoprotein (pyridoxamine 5'-phosphate oxidase superfamily)
MLLAIVWFLIALILGASAFFAGGLVIGLVVPGEDADEFGRIEATASAEADEYVDIVGLDAFCPGDGRREVLVRRRAVENAGQSVAKPLPNGVDDWRCCTDRFATDNERARQVVACQFATEVGCNSVAVQECSRLIVQSEALFHGCRVFPRHNKLPCSSHWLALLIAGSSRGEMFTVPRGEPERMTADNTEQVHGVGMSDAEIDGVLYEQGHGVLSLASDGDAYAVPVSFGYDGETIFMYLIQFDGQSKKLEFSEGAGTTCLTTYDVRDRSEWESLIVYGTLDAVPESEFGYMDEVMDDNAWFPSFHPPDWPITGVERTTLSLTSVTGRKGAGTGTQT